MRHSLGKSALRLAALAAGLCGIAATPAFARQEIVPYLEVQQVVNADLNGGDTLTYTALAAGIDASVSTKRAQAQVSYRYEQRIGWGKDVGEDDIHTGLARVDYQLSRDVTLAAGGIAARARTDIRGATPLFLTGNDDGVSQIYGFYAGPSFARTIGNFDVTAAYRFGYVNVDSSFGDALAPGQPVLDGYSSSTSHEFDASIGQRAGALPFAWTVSGGLVRENVNRLSQRYDARFIRGDVTLPVSYALALTAGVGYEKIRLSQRDILRNPDGSPVLSASGRLVGDPAAPRLLAYDTDGLIYDVGVIWRPNRRTTLEAHVGKRYGETIVTASLEHRISASMGIQAGIYNSVQSFGRQLTSRIATLPTAFRNPVNPLIGNLDSCVFGDTPGSGGCLDGSLQSVTTSNYRSRGAYALLSGGRGRWRYGIGAAYDQRKYLAPSSGALFSLAGVKDDSFVAEANLARDLSPSASIAGALYAQRYDSGIAATPATKSIGATATYDKSFSNHLTGQAGLGVYNTRQDGFADTVGTALIGLRYQF